MDQPVTPRVFEHDPDPRKGQKQLLPWIPGHPSPFCHSPPPVPDSPPTGHPTLWDPRISEKESTLSITVFKKCSKLSTYQHNFLLNLEPGYPKKTGRDSCIAHPPQSGGNHPPKMMPGAITASQNPSRITVKKPFLPMPLGANVRRAITITQFKFKQQPASLF